MHATIAQNTSQYAAVAQNTTQYAAIAQITQHHAAVAVIAQQYNSVAMIASPASISRTCFLIAPLTGNLHSSPDPIFAALGVLTVLRSF